MLQWSTVARGIAVLTVMLAVPVAAFGQIYEPEVQSRTVSALASYVEEHGDDQYDAQDAEATGYELFEVEVVAQIGPDHYTTANQSSQLETEAIHANGSSAANAFSIGGIGQAGCASSSSFEVEFSVTAPTEFRLTGTASATSVPGASIAAAWVTLVRVGDEEPIAGAEPACKPTCNAPFDQTGLLQPGRYVLEGYAATSGIVCCGNPTVVADASFDLDLYLGVTTCEADTNGDGVVDVLDLIAVLTGWGTDGLETGGDTDGSGLVDADDLVRVIVVWGPCE